MTEKKEEVTTLVTGPQPKKILEMAREAVGNAANERYVKKVRDIVSARDGFAKVLSEIDAVIAGLEAGDDLALEKAVRMADWVKEIKKAIGRGPTKTFVVDSNPWSAYSQLAVLANYEAEQD